jgi:hypothetical protein
MSTTLVLHGEDLVLRYGRIAVVHGVSAPALRHWLQIRPRSTSTKKGTATFTTPVKMSLSR